MTPIDTARAAWGDQMPDWVERLAQECASSSQSKAAQALGVSPAMVSTVLRGTYKGNMANVEERVRGALMRAVLTCPAIGEMPTHVCADWRRRAKSFTNTNALRVMMYRACISCPRFAELEKKQND